MDWFQYDNGLRHERVNFSISSEIFVKCAIYFYGNSGT